jgi:spermidine/putrescine transport system permease protein
LLAAPALLAAAALLLPAALLLVTAFWRADADGMHPALAADNFVRFLGNPGYARILLRSMGVGLAVSLISVLVAYPVAWFMAFDVKRRQLFWLVLISIPLWSSYLLRIFAWKVILGYTGLINSGLVSLGLLREPLLFLLYNPLAVVLTLVHAWSAFAVLAIFLSLQRIDPVLLEAAADLGDGPLRRFVRVPFVLALPGVLAAAGVIFVSAVGDYITPALVGGPDGLMIANVIQAQFGKAQDPPFGAALALVSIAACALVLAVLAGGARRLAGRLR